LEVGHIVASEHGGAQVEEPVAQVVARLDKGRPGFPAADAVDPEPALGLEVANGGDGGVAIEAGLVGGREAQRNQALLDVADGRAPMAETEGQALYRNAWSS
jgi:hypothetical protein